MSWYQKYLSIYEKSFSEIPQQLIIEVREKIAKLQSPAPLITVSIIAYNEEKHLFACLWALSEMSCKYPLEIIGTNNDSKDRTAEIFQAVDIPFETEYQHSCGFARLNGLKRAKGKYHINIDADTLYPRYYVEIMADALQKKNIVAVNSSWSYFPDENHSWLGLKFYEFTRDTYLFLQSLKRPELSVRGLVFAYHTQQAQETGIRTDIRRGEDGFLALQLKKYGRIHFIHKRKARAITGYGTVGADGSFINSFRVRAVKALKHAGSLFSKKEHYQDDESNLIH